jgi:hypothetical protein
MGIAIFLSILFLIILIIGIIIIRYDYIVLGYLFVVFGSIYSIIGNIITYGKILPNIIVNRTYEEFKPEIHKFSDRVVVVDPITKESATFYDIGMYNAINDSSKMVIVYKENSYGDIYFESIKLK